LRTLLEQAGPVAQLDFLESYRVKEAPVASQENKKQLKSNESPTAGTASQGSPLGPGSFCLADARSWKTLDFHDKLFSRQKTRSAQKRMCPHQSRRRFTRKNRVIVEVFRGGGR
jgi:hypothetical protein